LAWPYAKEGSELTLPNKADNIRLLAVHPYGSRTGRFIEALRRRPGKRVEVVEANDLPHLEYRKGTYIPAWYTEEVAMNIFMAHARFYEEQWRAAMAQDQGLCSVAGRFHEGFAPFYCAAKTVTEKRIRVNIVDAHLDCFSAKLSGGSYLRWLIVNEHLTGEDVVVVRPDVIVNDGISLSEIVDNLLNNMARSLAKQWYADYVSGRPLDLVAIAEERVRVQPILQILGGTFEMPGTIGSILARRISRELEKNWATKHGIRFGVGPSLVLSSGPALINFDGDASFEGSILRNVDALAPYFARMQMAQVLGAYYCELDSPDCNFDPEALAELV
jgi:hypothetical protein